MSNFTEWVLIQRNTLIGEGNFEKDWFAYKNGFGTQSGDFWIGLEKLHNLTVLESQVRLRIEYTTRSCFWGWSCSNRDRNYYIIYDIFTVDSEDEYYKLEISGFSGNGKDIMRRNNGGEFFTQDNYRNKGCYRSHLGGWWFNSNCKKSLNKNNFLYIATERVRKIEMKIQRK